MKKVVFPQQDFSCPKCKCGFVEKLSDAPPNVTHGATGVGGGHGQAHFQEIPFLEVTDILELVMIE